MTRLNRLGVWAFLLFLVSPTAARAQMPRTDLYNCPECNVIFISATNVRADHLSFYGYDRDTAPTLAELAKKSIVFDSAYTVASWTLPAATSVFTSLYPFQHEVMARDKEVKTRAVGGLQDRLADEKITLFDVFRQAGYLTASINAGVDYLPEHGVTDRADFGVSYNSSYLDRWRRYGSSEDVVPEAIRWLEKYHQKKFFLQLQVYDAHCPFASPRDNPMFDPNYHGEVDFTRCYWTYENTEPKKIEEDGVVKTYYQLTSPDVPMSQKIKYGKACTQTSCLQPENPYEFMLNERDIYHMVALYDGEIHNIDAQLKSLFAALKKMGLLDKTIIVFFSEHGDMFGKHGRFMRGGHVRGTFYDDVMRVPLIVYHPRLKSQRISSPISLVDLGPSILEFLNIPKPSQFYGESVRPLLQGQVRDRKIYGGSVFIPPRRLIKKKDLILKGLPADYSAGSVIMMVRDKGMKLIRETTVVPPGYHGATEAEVQTYYELYDLKKDPQELIDVKEALPDRVKQLDEDLNAWFYSLTEQKYESLIERLKSRLFSRKEKSDE